MDTQIIKVTVKKWDKSRYKPRKDVEFPTWFKCSNRLLEDPDFYEFAPEERLVWYRILELVSQKQSQTVEISLEHCERACRLPKKFVKTAVQKLEIKGLIKIDESSTLRARNADVTSTLHREEKKREEERREEQPAVQFDFDSLYSAYPRKRGKDAGMKRLRARIKTAEEFADFSKAVRKYATEMRVKRTEEKFILMWSTFVGTDKGEPWQDFVDQSAPPAPQTPLVARAFESEASASVVLANELPNDLRQKLAILSGKREGA